MPQIHLPGWLSKRARECSARFVHVLHAPATPRSAAVYLIECANTFELHAVDDAESGIDGATIAMTRREANAMLLALSGGLSGRLSGVDVRPFPPLPVEPPAPDVKP
jgi:hypothetical protein